jgi:hypothetical protein
VVSINASGDNRIPLHLIVISKIKTTDKPGLRSVLHLDLFGHDGAGMHDMNQPRLLTDSAKHRLRIAGRFLRQQGNRFDGGNFYELVIAAISKLDTARNEHLHGIVLWVEEYEMTERTTYGEPTRSRARKNKRQQAESARCALRLPTQNLGSDCKGKA